jgi:F0F1-type ATP synthase membrane subunit b/b'
MDFDFSMFLSWQAVLFCLGIYAIVYVIRTALETFIAKIKDNRYWRELALPVMGIIIGIGLGAAFSGIPMPDGISTISARMTFGAVCGLLSSFVYNRIKSWIKSKTETIIPGQESQENAVPEVSPDKDA